MLALLQVEVKSELKMEPLSVSLPLPVQLRRRGPRPGRRARRRSRLLFAGSLPVSCAGDASLAASVISMGGRALGLGALAGLGGLLAPSDCGVDGVAVNVGGGGGVADASDSELEQYMEIGCMADRLQVVQSLLGDEARQPPRAQWPPEQRTAAVANGNGNANANGNGHKLLDAPPPPPAAAAQASPVAVASSCSPPNANASANANSNECLMCHRVLSCKSALLMHYRTHTGKSSLHYTTTLSHSHVLDAHNTWPRLRTH